MKIRVVLIVLFIFTIIPFSYCQFQSKVVPKDSDKFELILYNDSVISRKVLTHKVIKLRQADIDNDGKDEVIIGAFRSTALDTVKRYRINIWKLDSNLIKPKWLGSFLPHPLYDFEIFRVNNNNFIRTIEYEENGLYLVSEYKWHSFGLKHIRYLERNISIDKARNLLIQPK